MKTVITILCDNWVATTQDVVGEHGLSMLIERGEERTLLDTGQGMAIARNARVLGKSLSGLSRLVLSHGHYDHTGGLPQVLRASRGLEVAAHPGIFDDHLATLDTPLGKKTVYVGMRYDRRYLESGLGARFRFLRECLEIAPGILASGEVAHKTDFEKGDPRLVIKDKELLLPDPLPDDVSLLVETSKGPVVILGCAHAGTVNILNHFAEKTGFRRFYGVIGGAHLNNAAPEQLKGTLDCLEAFGVEKVALNHCTGLASAVFMAQHLGSRFVFSGVGWSMEL
jgi:7,8-dihydropterin-6-yl-methyl-4-(beta-D-ribofuranosyl)aminobenzene 5'-phosphate synthase